MNLNPTPHNQTYRMELFLRSLAPPGIREQQETIINRVAQLSTNGTIQEHTLTIWGDRIRLDTAPQTDTEEAIREKIERIRRWEATNSVSLAPGFEERQINSPIEGSYTVLILPIIGLAVYTQTDIWGIFPCKMEESHISVMECVEAFLQSERSLEAQSTV